MREVSARGSICPLVNIISDGSSAQRARFTSSVGVRCVEELEGKADVTVSLENQFYLELGVLSGWVAICEKDAPSRVRQAIQKLHDLGLGIIGKSEEQLREEVEAQAHLLNDALNDIDDLKQLGNMAVRLAADEQFKAEAGPEIVHAFDELDSRNAEAPIAVTPRVDGQPDGALSPVNPFNPNGNRGKREWTPEQRAEQAERARNQHKGKPPFDSDLEAVKADWEAGISFAAIGGKYGCSDGHIRNFLKRHGIDPCRGRPGVRNGGRPALTEADIQLIIDEKAKGTPSKEIGEMIDRSQHAVDQKYSDLKRDGLVPAEHLAPEFLVTKKQRQNEIVSEKMKGYHAGKRQEAMQDESPVAEEDHQPPTAYQPESPAARWKPSPIDSAEWPDIQQMLAKGMTREAIAGDYDVPLDDLNDFIEARLAESKARREVKSPPGESVALSPAEVGSAA